MIKFYKMLFGIYSMYYICTLTNGYPKNKPEKSGWIGIRNLLLELPVAQDAHKQNLHKHR